MPENEKTAFVIMPFDAELNDVYSELLLPVLRDVGFFVRRADDIFSHQNILRDIVQSIAEADLVVADLTGLNPNVFYELGVAHGLRKRVILLTQNIDEVPFDLRSYRIIHYQTHFARVEQARHLLRETAQGAFDRAIEFGSPVTDFLRSSGLAAEQAIGPEGGANAKPPPLTQAEEERGWLDHTAAMESGFVRLTEILGRVTGATVEIGEETTKYSERIQRAKQSSEPNPNARLRFIITEYARTLAEYGARLAKANEEYEAVALETQDSIEFIILHGQLPDADSLQKLGEFVATLAKVEEAAMGSRETYVQMRTTVQGLEGIEKHLTRAAKIVGNQMDQFLANVDSTIASVRRGIAVGTRRLQQERGGAA